jgi:hypothetical protein
MTTRTAAVGLALSLAPWLAAVSGEAPRPDPATSQLSGVVVFDPKIYGRPAGKPVALAPDRSNVNTTQDAQAQNETSIDINPLVPEVMVGGMNDYRTSPSGDVNCGFARSSNGGLAWTAGILLGITQNNGGPFDYQAAGDPAVYYAADGTVHYVCLGFDRGFGRSALLHVKSSNGGATWSTPVAIVQSQSVNTFHDKEMLTIDTSASSPFQGNLYVQWTQFLNNFSQSRMFITVSSDGGDTWSEPVLISGAQSGVQGASPAVGPDGTVYASWCSPCGGAARIWVNTSSDGGATWGTPVQAATLSGLPGSLPGNGFRVNNFPTAAVNQATGDVYLSYADYAAGNADIKFVRSTDDGATWSAPLRVNSRPQDDQFFQWMDVSPNGRLWICYYDQSWNGTNWLDMSCSSSTNGGVTFGEARRMTTVSSNPANDGFGGSFIGDYNGLAVRASRNPRPLWTDTRTGNAESFVGGR